MFGTPPGSGIGLQRFCNRLACLRRFATGPDTFKQFKGFKARTAASGQRARGRIDLEAGFDSANEL